MTTLNTLGWIGSVCFAVCAVPDTYRTLKTGKSPKYSWDFLMLWFSGEFCTMSYFAIKYTLFDPIMFNYIFNFLCLCVIIAYKSAGR